MKIPFKNAVKVLHNISYTFNYIIIGFYLYRIKNYYFKFKIY